MTAILYPVAETAEAAVHQPRGFAAREREASQICAGEVAFATASVGPAFATREAALAAYAGQLGEDQSPGSDLEPKARWRQLRAVAAEPPTRRSAAPAPVQPAFVDGRRWPVRDPETQPAVAWRLSVSYWRILGTSQDAPESAARTLRRSGAGLDLDGPTLGALARQPLRPTRPQQPLDIGLFEFRLPESPEIVMPDE